MVIPEELLCLVEALEKIVAANGDSLVLVNWEG